MPQVLSRLQSQSHSYIQDQSDHSKEADIIKTKHDLIKLVVQKEEADPNKLLMSGYLYKKSQRYHNYKRRWFVLRNCQLSYYKDDSEYKPLGVIHGVNLLSINVDDKESHHHKSKFYFKIHTDQKKLQLYADDESTLKRWISALKEAIDYNCNSVNDIDEEQKLEARQDEHLEPPVNNYLEYNTSSAEQFSGVEDLNYTSNASDSNTNHLSSSLPQQILPAINENKINHHKVEKERLKLKIKLLNNQVQDENGTPATDIENKILLDDILSADSVHEIIIEKGQMSRLYKRYNQWKKFFVILTNKNLLFYKFTPTTLTTSIEEILRLEKASKVIKIEDVLDIVELEALSKSKPWCLLIITKQKRVRFSVETEEELIKWLVATTMLINRRKEKLDK